MLIFDIYKLTATFNIWKISQESYSFWISIKRQLVEISAWQQIQVGCDNFFSKHNSQFLSAVLFIYF